MNTLKQIEAVYGGLTLLNKYYLNNIAIASSYNVTNAIQAAIIHTVSTNCIVNEDDVLKIDKCIVVGDGEIHISVVDYIEVALPIVTRICDTNGDSKLLILLPLHIFLEDTKAVDAIRCIYELFKGILSLDAFIEYEPSPLAYSDEIKISSYESVYNMVILGYSILVSKEWFKDMPTAAILHEIVLSHPEATSIEESLIDQFESYYDTSSMEAIVNTIITAV